MPIKEKINKEKVLNALRKASEVIDEIFPDAWELCKTTEEKTNVLAIRDACKLAYLRALERTLRHTGPLFDQLTKDLEATAGQIASKIKKVKDAVEAINLFTDVFKLAGSLSLAFA